MLSNRYLYSTNYGDSEWGYSEATEKTMRQLKAYDKGYDLFKRGECEQARKTLSKAGIRTANQIVDYCI